MLRCHYLPSDFHPLLMMVGERNDLALLARVLAGFASRPQPVAIHRLPVISYSVCAITLQHYESTGIVLAADGLLWRIDRATAQAYADEIEEMLAEGLQSGSCFLEIGYIDEIRVKISFGEFDDGWLLEEK